MTLSTESTRFLEDLKVYLLASGKNEQATNEIVLELEDHLIEAEADGKSVRAITGDSPAAYIQSISHEMAFDSKQAFWTIMQVYLGASSFLYLQNLLNGTTTYSILLVGGFLLISAVYLTTLALLFRKDALRDTARPRLLRYGIHGSVHLLLIVGLLIVNGLIDSPKITLSPSVGWLIGALLIAWILITAWKTKTWILPIAVFVFFVPQLLLLFVFNLSEITAVLVSYVLTSITIAVTFICSSKNSQAD
ncbi:hypothetical protein AS033_14520 [Exiguobacterium indicum]|uniref:Uncharacterized protein n=1 Tax=Exiguobacterium indicum TaxID=296995 RepID=A0A0V8GC56_9BACL|nr:hypothetical protein [Exiguobacterium enclense]KSU47872.1 hypothetical protein AS033_14520 [Exiguobacterium enclense]SDD30326.1 hypothetical protein SAMN05216342_2958 [Exiguobacterium enclense]